MRGRALAVVVGVGLGLGLLGFAGLLRTPVGDLVGSVLPGESPTHAAYRVACVPTGGATCSLDGFGPTWTLLPPREWCTKANDTPSAGGAGTNLSAVGTGAWHCGATTFVVVVIGSGPTTLAGVVRVDGPVTIWIDPSVDQCELAGSLTKMPLPCPPPAPPVPDYPPWNLTFPHAGLVNFSELGFDFGEGAGVLPPVSWTIEMVDAQAAPENATVVVPLTVSSA